MLSDNCACKTVTEKPKEIKTVTEKPIELNNTVTENPKETTDQDDEPELTCKGMEAF